MDTTILFTVALGLQSPWFIKRVEFTGKGADKQLHLYLDHQKGVKFKYGDTLCPVYDHQDRKWRHLNFFEHECYLHASVPRIKTPDGEVRLVEVPWAQPGSSFTLLFEAYAALLVHGGMSMLSAGSYMGVDGRIVSRIISRMVATALATQELEPVEHLGVDETSITKGHNYITVLTDISRKKVVGIALGKDVQAFNNALMDLESRGAKAEDVKVVTMDMSPAYISAVQENMPKADIVFDRFHLHQSLNHAIDQIRREESKQIKELRKTRFIWIKGYQKLSQTQRNLVDQLADTFPTIGTAYRLKEQFKVVLDEAYHKSDLEPLKQWKSLALDSGIEHIISFVKTLERHWYGIVTYFQHHVTNAIAESVNLKIQQVKRVSRGVTNLQNFIHLIYFHLGGLDLNLPTKNS